MQQPIENPKAAHFCYLVEGDGMKRSSGK